MPIPPRWWRAAPGDRKTEEARRKVKERAGKAAKAASVESERPEEALVVEVAPPEAADTAERRRRFAREYLMRGGNGAEACRATGYNETHAQHLLATEEVKAVLAATIQVALEKEQPDGEARVAVAAARVVQELARLGLSDIGEMYDERGNLLPVRDMPEAARRAIKAVKYKADGSVAIELWDKGKALELLGKHAGLFVERTEVTVRLPAEERERRIRTILERGRARAALAAGLPADGSSDDKESP